MGDHLEATVDPGIRARQAAVGAPAGFEDVIASVAPVEAGSTAHWHVSFSVTDRDRTADLAIELGGEVVSTEDGEWTRTAQIRDPAGATLTATQFTPPS